MLSESGAERTRQSANGQLVENIIIIFFYFLSFSKFGWEGIYSFFFVCLFCFCIFLLQKLDECSSLWLISLEATGQGEKKKKAQWRRSPSTTCSSSTQPTWIRFYAVSESRTFPSARASRTPRQNLKVTHTDLILRYWETPCPKMGNFIHKFDVNFAPKAANYLQIMPNERPLWASLFAPVRITHMAQVLCKANAVCSVLVVTHVLRLCTSSAYVKWYELLWRTGLRIKRLLYMIQKTWKIQFCTHWNTKTQKLAKYDHFMNIRVVVTEFKSDDFMCLLTLWLRYQPDGPDRPLQPHLPPQRPGQQPHHRRPGAEQAHEDRHQPLPAVPVRQRPDGVPGLHPLHPHPQPHEGLHLRHCHMQAGHVLHGWVEGWQQIIWIVGVFWY